MPEPIKAIFSSVDLTVDEQGAIEESNRWSVEALAQLGAAFLDYSDMEKEFLRAKTKLTSCKGGALEAELQRGKVVASIAATKNLPPGEWVYDSVLTKLVRKDV